MKVFLAVLEDLLNFVINREKTEAILAVPYKMSSATSVVKVDEVRPILPEVVTKTDFSESSNHPILLEDMTRAYVTVNSAKVMTRPVWTFDTVLTVAPYASSLTVFDYSGRFAKVKYKEVIGWVLKDDITTSKEAVVPIFESTKSYLANDPDTKKLRIITDDEFFASDLYLPLQSVEYVHYELISAGRSLVWTAERPRLAGSWQKILKGHLGVHIGIVPKTGSVMEYIDEEGEGKVGYVEAVRPDESIVLSSVGRLIEGQFLREEISKETWLDLRPVWIQIQ